MPTLDEARGLILERIGTLGRETVELVDSLGLVTAEDIASPWDMPLCSNSAMDGFAVRSADCQSNAELRVTGFIPAGSSSSFKVEPGCAIRIMTGALIPEGCDVVVPFEQAEDHGERVMLKEPIRLHQHIRFAGTDVRRGEIVIPAGTVIGVSDISMMAGCGMSCVNVFRRPTVAILSTGDELLGIGEKVSPGMIVDSNGVSLAAAVKACGARVELLGIARDTHESLVEKMTTGLEADIFITTAGVSVGERDLVREVLTGLGVSQVFYGVEVRPGGPSTFGVKENRLVFCLPGNPVATILIFEELVRPAILKAMGYKRILQPSVRAVLKERVTKSGGRVKLERVRLVPGEGGLLAASSGDQSTGMLKTLLRADGVALLPAERTSLDAGEEVDVHLYSANVLMRTPVSQSSISGCSAEISFSLADE
jgi:molybdopterin molybdotransferase